MSRTRAFVVLPAICAVCLFTSACNDSVVNSNLANSSAGVKSPGIASVQASTPIEVPVVVEDEADPKPNSIASGVAGAEQTDVSAVNDAKSDDTKGSSTVRPASAESVKLDKPPDAAKPTEVAPAAPGKPVPGKVEILVKDRTFKTETGALRVSYDDIDLLKVINMEPVTADAVEKMPSWLRDLHGKRIRIRGFMYPPFQETGIARFVLARDNQICCFGRNPKIYDLIAITMKKGTTTDYIQNRPFDVVGTFRIEMEALEDGEFLGLYYLDDATVIEK